MEDLASEIVIGLKMMVYNVLFALAVVAANALAVYIVFNVFL